MVTYLNVYHSQHVYLPVSLSLVEQKTTMTGLELTNRSVTLSLNLSYTHNITNNAIMVMHDIMFTTEGKSCHNHNYNYIIMVL